MSDFGLLHSATDNATVDDCGYAVVTVPEGCDACHGAPPTKSTHPPNNRCFRCHGQVVDKTFAFIQSGMHQNGTVEYAVGCTSCHGWDLGVSPPQNLKGKCSEGINGTGAHAALRRDAVPAHQVNCSNCHSVPLSTWADGHIDGDGQAEVVFSNLAVAGNAVPVWDGKTCANVYCHGATLTGGDYKEPGWYETGGRAGECGACHRLTDPQGNADADCHSCHPTSVNSANAILPYGTHINGVIDLDNATSGGGA